MKIIERQWDDISNFIKKLVPDSRKHFTISILAGFTDAFINLLFAFMLKNVYSSISLQSSSKLKNSIIFFVIILALVFIYNCILWQLCGRSSARISGKIKATVFSKLLLFNMPRMERFNSSDVISIMTTDLNEAQRIYSEIRVLVSVLLLGVMSTILIFPVSWRMGAIILLLGILQLFVNIYVVNPLERLSGSVRKNTGDINNAFTSILENNAAIRLNLAEDYYINKSRELCRSLYRRKMKINMLNAVVMSVNVIFGLLGYIAVLIIGSIFIQNGAFTVAELLFITQMRFMLIQGILILGDYSQRIQPSITGIRKVLHFIKEDVEDTRKQSL